MTDTFNLVSTLISLMKVRQVGVFTDDSVKVAHYTQWADARNEAALCRPVSVEDSHLVKALVDAMVMQDHREAGEFHLSSDAALAIWNPALKAGEDYLAKAASSANNAVTGTPAVSLHPVLSETGAEGYLKQRAEAMGRALGKFDVKLKHSQLLAVVARMEGRESFQSLKSAVSPHVPNFCPHCGAAATLKQVDTVYCEQGEYDGKEYQAEGEGQQYQCSRCQGQFTDWVGLDVPGVPNRA